MTALDNQRHELFAQNVAGGMTQTRAYIEAGYSDDGAAQNAARLMTNDKVIARVRELQTEGAKGVGLTIERLTDDLLRVATKGEALGDASGLSVARAAYMDAAKLNGLIVDKKQFVGPTIGELLDELGD